MKKLFLIAVLFSFVFTNAQQVSDYKYIIVPKKFQEFDENEYRLNYYLKNLLTKKNYIILNEDVQEWPVEVQQNACLALTADVKKRKNFLKNKVELVFTSCSQQQVGMFEGDTSIKEYEKGYQDALKTAVLKMKVQNPNAVVHQTEAPASEKENADVKENIVAETITIYSNGEISLTKSDLTDGSFLLINQNNSQVYAQFFSSTRNGIFHVKVIDPKGNYDTIGYFDGTTLEIELSNSTNKWVVTQFKKLQ